MYNAGEMSLTKVVFSSNTAEHGGAAIYNRGKMVVDGGVFEYNKNGGGAQGAAIQNNGEMYLKGDLLFYKNKERHYGGAIYNSNKLIIDDNAKFI